MHDILCIYYSRSGNTRAAAEEIAAALDAELAEITDAQDRYLPAEHQLAVSLRPGSEGYDFWLGDFVQNVQRLLAE